MRIRKNARYLTNDEKNVFLRAVLTLKSQTQPGVSPAMSRYDYFVLLHLAATRVFFSGITHNMAHGTAMFLPWHREYILRFENALRATIPGVTDNLTLPYWDWTYAPPSLMGGSIVETDPVLRSDFLGGNGGSDQAGGVTVLPSGGSMLTGYFMHNAPAVPPVWWPSGLLGWRIPNRLGVPQSDDSGTQALTRSLGSGPSGLPTVASVDTSLSMTTYATFRNHLEGASHAAGHNWFVGHMSNPSRSPSDPMFFLHHANVDRLWALWQIHGTATDTYDAAAPSPYGLMDPLWPWGWAAGSFSLTPWYTALPVPDHSAEAARRPNDVLDHHALGYRYDSEIVLGIALDRSGSMQGPTPDPMTGAPPNLTKWNAAVLGVQAFYQDCAVAFASREAYVTSGVLLFGTAPLGGNELVPVWPAPGVIRASGTHSASGFAAALGSTTPSGGTPIAAAIAQTEASLVRAPYPTSMSDDPRYQAFLTDGLETAAPLLSSIPNHTYSATRIFAMGFGIGSGWDGVSYTGIQSIVDKGAPAIPGVNQVFHGENAGEIDKFFGDTITRVLDFSHMTDPLYELAAGEHVHTPFMVNASDDAVFVTVQGYDYDAAKWSVDVVAPNGAAYSSDNETPVRVRVLRGRGRTSMMLQRSQATDADWVGTWHVRTARLGKHAGHHVDHAVHEMFMPELWSQLRPQGAPRIQVPLRVAPGARRLPERFTPDVAVLLRTKTKLGGLRLPPHITDVCAVSVNVSHRGRVRTQLDIPKKHVVAGQGFEVRLRLDGPTARDLEDIRIAGRLVAPAFSIGNLLADTKTVPIDKRVRDPITGNVNLHRFLVDFENAAPYSLSMRDEEVLFERDADGSLCARIRATYPGVHYVSMYFEATDAGSPTRERVHRILTTEVAVGLAIDARLSAPKVKVIGKKTLQISFTPQDALGNIAAPGRSGLSQLVLNGAPVEARALPTLGAERTIEVDLHAGADHKLEAPWCVCRTDGRMVAIDPEGQLHAQIFWGGVALTSGEPSAMSPGTGDDDHDHGHGHGHGRGGARPARAKRKKPRR